MEGNETKATPVVDSYSIISVHGPIMPKEYYNYVVARFHRSLTRGNDYFRLIPHEIYKENYDKYLRSVIQRKDTIIRLAVLNPDRDIILGFSILEPGVLHYVYVARDYRLQGIGKALIPQHDFDAFTHITEIGLKLWPKKFPKAIFNPFI